MNKFSKPGIVEVDVNNEACLVSIAVNGDIVITREKHSDLKISAKDLIELLDGQGLIKA